MHAAMAMHTFAWLLAQGSYRFPTVGDDENQVSYDSTRTRSTVACGLWRLEVEREIPINTVS